MEEADYKQPLSHKYFRVSFNGFLPRGKNKISIILANLVDLLGSLVTYVKTKFNTFSKYLYTLLILLIQFPIMVKNYVTVKLIWSRGKLGRRIAPVIVLIASVVVFAFGKLFSSSSLVSAQEVNPDYVSYVSDIVPKKYIATTTIPEDRKRAESFVYAVEGGDTISGIGEKFKISRDALLYVNNLSEYSVLKIGQELTIPPVSGLIHTVEDGDTLNSIATKYDVAPQAVADFNYILDTSSLAVGTELVIPGASIPEKVPVYAAVPTGITSVGTASATPNNSFCVWPTTSRIITQYYYWYHNGLDVSTPSGWGMPPIFACTGGEVTRAGWDPWGLGLHVRIDHGNGYESIYGHMSRIDVSYGERVSRGQNLGLMGSTGNSTGPHVHFIVNYNGISQNPLNYTQ